MCLCLRSRRHNASRSVETLPKRKEVGMTILMVLTSHDMLGNTGRKTGFWLEELAGPHYTFKDAGAEIEFMRELRILVS